MNTFIIIILLTNIIRSFSREIFQMKLFGLQSCEVINNIINNINKTRNEYFRFLLSNETNKLKRRFNIVKRVANRNIQITYNKILSIYYDYTYDYYSLSEDDLSFIEAVISLSY